MVANPPPLSSEDHGEWEVLVFEECLGVFLTQNAEIVRVLSHGEDQRRKYPSRSMFVRRLCVLVCGLVLIAAGSSKSRYDIM